MRLLVLSLLVFVVNSADARAASFGAPVTIGTAPTLATAAAAGSAGAFAFVARQQNVVVGAVRDAGGAWATRLLASGRPYSQRDLQLVVGSDGAFTAVWTAGSPHPALVAARAVAGSGFGKAQIVARLNDARGAHPRMVALQGGRVLVVFNDRTSPQPGRVSSHRGLKSIELNHGRASAVRDLGVKGFAPAIARAGDGAMLVYFDGALRCRHGTCLPRALRATLLDALGRRAGATVTVASNVGGGNPPRVTSAGSRAVVSGVRTGLGSRSPFTRDYSTRPLRPRSSARQLAIYGGPGANTPTIAILRSGDLLGAGVGGSLPGQPFGGGAQISVESDSTMWQAPTSLSAPAGWTTVPQVQAFRDGGAVAIFARSRSEPGPASYDVIAAERSPAGTITQTTLGSSLNTNDASGLASSVGADDQLIVTWPNNNGGVDVILRP